MPEKINSQILQNKRFVEVESLHELHDDLVSLNTADSRRALQYLTSIFGDLCSIDEHGQLDSVAEFRVAAVAVALIVNLRSVYEMSDKGHLNTIALEKLLRIELKAQPSLAALTGGRQEAVRYAIDRYHEFLSGYTLLAAENYTQETSSPTAAQRISQLISPKE